MISKAVIKQGFTLQIELVLQAQQPEGKMKQATIS